MRHPHMAWVADGTKDSRAGEEENSCHDMGRVWEERLQSCANVNALHGLLQVMEENTLRGLRTPRIRSESFHLRLLSCGKT